MTRALILIMDPSHETRSMYAECFRHHGFAVAEAADGVEAVRLFHQLQPDVVVTELSSEAEWAGAIRTVRGEGTGRQTPIIACSTSIDPRWPCAPAGFDVDLALGKPVSPHVLLNHAERLVRGRAGQVREALV